MSNSWEDFKRLNTLSLGFAESMAKQATIFGNGKNQVEILVTLSMQGTDNQPLEISKEELLDAIYLCDYRTGEILSAPWTYRPKPNEFNRAVSYQNVATINRNLSSVEEQAGKLNVRLYVSADSPTQNGIIAVGIRVPGVGDFDTTEDGTGVPNGPGGETGSPFKNPKYLNITALPAIDYSEIKNLEVTADEFQEISYNLWWEARSKSNGSYGGEKTASAKKRTIEISPKSDIPGNKFFRHSVIGRALRNSDVNLEEIEWHGKNYPCFNPIQDDDSFDKPCTVIGKGYEDEQYEVNFYFSGEKNAFVNGVFYIENWEAEYNCTVTAHTGPAYDPESGKARLVILKSIVPRQNCGKKGWRNAIRKFDIYLTDIYGNEGTTTMNFDDKNYFDSPHIGG